MGLLHHLPKILAVAGAGVGIIVVILNGWFPLLLGVVAVGSLVYLGFRWQRKQPG